MDAYDTERAFCRAKGIIPLSSSLLDPHYDSETKRYRDLSALRAGVPRELMDEGKTFGDRWPRIRFFRTLKRGEKAAGWYHPELPMWIWIHADLSLKELPRVVSHEVQHFADALHGYALREDAADKFAEGFVLEMAVAHEPSLGLRVTPSIQHVYR